MTLKEANWDFLYTSQTHPTSQMVYYATRTAVLLWSPFQKSLIPRVIRLDNTSFITTRDYPTLPTLMTIIG